MHSASVVKSGMLELRIAANSAEEVRRLAQDAAGPLNFDNVSDDALLGAVRARMRSRGLVVNVEPFESEDVA
jgi:hypothetical protein